MRKIVVFCLLLCNIVAFSQGKAQICFQWKTIDLCKIDSKNGETFHVNFVFTNNGGVPLVINQVKASCGCTVPRWSKAPIMPGKKGVIEVNFNPKGQKGFLQKSIFVQSNSEEDVVLLKIKGQIE